MEKSDSIAKLATALAKAQGQMEDAAKSSTNPHFKSKYADLASVRDAIREPLAANGLSYIQMPRINGNMVEVETLLMHESGECISDVLKMPFAKPDAHGIGSAITYARRYALMGVFGIAPDDDDGNAATNKLPLTPVGDISPPKRIERKPAGIVPIDAEKSAETRSMLERAVSMAQTREDLHDWAKANKATLDSLTEEDRQFVRDHYRTTEANIQIALSTAAE